MNAKSSSVTKTNTRKPIGSHKDIADLLLGKKPTDSKEEVFWVLKDGRLQKEQTPKKAVGQVKPAAPTPVNTRSYVHGPPTHTMQYNTLPELLERCSKETPDKEAHVFWTMHEENRLQREMISFSALSERSSILAGNFLSVGLKPGDRVAIIGDNCPDWLYVEYAALRIQLCLVRLNSSLVTAESVRRVVFQQQCRAMIVSPGKNDAILKKVIKVIPGMKSVDDLLAKLPNMRLMTMGEPRSNMPIRSIQELLESSERIEEVIEIQDAIDPHDIAIAYSTSGSSGFPKFVAMTHYSYINNVLATDNNQFQAPETRFFNDRPFTWIGSGLHSAVCLDITIVHMDAAVTQSANNTGVVLSVMEEEQITVMMSMCTIMNQVRESANGEHEFPGSVKHLLSGGEPLSNDLLVFCKETFESTVLLYASSESFVASRGVLSKNTPASKRPYRLQPLPHVEMKVTDEDEKTVPIGQPGRLWVRSPYLFESYLNYAAQESSKTLFHKSGGRGQGLWFNTDDLAVVDDEGSIEVIGRQSDIITRDDVVIYPHTYESSLREYPKVNDVYVSGVPDSELGQEISVCVSFQKGYWVSEEAISVYYERKGIDPLPKYYVVLDQFPHVPNGKMDRKALNALVLEKYKESDE